MLQAIAWSIGFVLIACLLTLLGFGAGCIMTTGEYEWRPRWKRVIRMVFTLRTIVEIVMVVAVVLALSGKIHLAYREGVSEGISQEAMRRWMQDINEKSNETELKYQIRKYQVQFKSLQDAIHELRIDTRVNQDAIKRIESQFCQ